MPNITYPELAETKTQPLPPASLEALKAMRDDLCSSSSSDFKLQPSQRFLRRVLSPDSPTRNLLMVHGAGSGKTCNAIQIAEEYIIRPEFQDKKVFILANPSIQENFKAQIFDISRVSVDPDGILLSKQCTGRRYLEMIQRSQAEPLRYTDRASQIRIMNLASRLISEFYEFQGYVTFANMIERQKLESKTSAEMEQWIHTTFDNRLIIVDEAHNLRETSETDTTKLVGIAIEQILKVANGVTLVLLTATPMYDKYDEILYYFNLFLWNDRKLSPKTTLKPSDFFDANGDFKEGKEDLFRGYCQEYVSFVKGENPFTFPFRLPPPQSIQALPDRDTDPFGETIQTPRKYLTLTGSIMSEFQSEQSKKVTVRATSDPRLICSYPDGKSFRDVFEKSENSFSYREEKFLSPSKISKYSSKFGLIMNILNTSTGMAFVYSNIVEGGAQLFAMCLEEHGFEPAFGDRLLKETSNEVTRGSKGKYVLFTSDISDNEIKRALLRIRRRENVDGSDIRVVIASPKVSEGVDFRYIRQVHILDPWFNMSRLEQVIGRGMRTCSHSFLPFEHQNCTIYLHVCRYPDSKQETVDEFIYRTFVEEKASKIAKVKRVIMESAMDCPLQETVNSLPESWRQLEIPQIRNQDGVSLQLSLSEMTAPTFEDSFKGLVCKVKESIPDPEHIRPLSAILDVRDEVLDKLLKLFAKKPIWLKDDLFNHSTMKYYSEDVISFILQNAIESKFQLKDRNGRIGHLEAKDGVFAFAIGDNDTMLDRLLKEEHGQNVELPIYTLKEESIKKEVSEKPPDIVSKIEEFGFSKYIRDNFSEDILAWFIVDNVLTEKEKIHHFLSLNWDEPPIYAKDLSTTTTTGKRLYILGSNKVYNQTKELITPIGAERDAYNKWIRERKTWFLSKKTDIFATMKDQVIVFNVDEKSNIIQRALRSKTIGGRACTSYTESVLNAFSMFLSDAPFPPDVKSKKDRCVYLDLLFRRAIAGGRDGIFWLTPEEFSIFNEDQHRTELLKAIKE